MLKFFGFKADKKCSDLENTMTTNHIDNGIIHITGGESRAYVPINGSRTDARF